MQLFFFALQTLELRSMERLGLLQRLARFGVFQRKDGLLLRSFGPDNLARILFGQRY